MLATTVALHDVRDADAFVHATINDFCKPNGSRGAIVLSVDEHDELAAEGLAIMCRLAADYCPRMEGYEQDGCFSGYAAWSLPKKLGDAWHRMHPNHQLATDPVTGRRRWLYGLPAVSLEAIVAESPDRSDLLSDRRKRADLGPRLHAALFERWCREVKVVVEVGELLGEGATPADVAKMLGLTAAQVKEAMSQIEPVLPRLLSEEEL
jgi:hypothetical protein